MTKPFCQLCVIFSGMSFMIPVCQGFALTAYDVEQEKFSRPGRPCEFPPPPQSKIGHPESRTAEPPLSTVRASAGQKNPVPVDVGKGIENKLDDLLKAIQGLSVDALKAAQLQGMLMGAIVAAIVLTFIIAVTRK
jgi:hypothetical protein